MSRGRDTFEQILRADMVIGSSPEDLDRVGLTMSEVENARDVARSMGIRKPCHPVALYEKEFGPPDECIVTAEGSTLTYTFGTWPEFAVDILGDRLGGWHGWRFRRVAGAPGKPIEGWKWLLGEVRAAPGTPAASDPWYPWDWYEYDDDGGVWRLRYGFAFGLLEKCIRARSTKGELSATAS